ncbi:phosphatidylcholine transfer protein isoform X2 [Petaurus breviceps papuanus]|uniref:phosphatidylcholine transfer protein isoform X2 n=1 Tax=Petaurus breviceps papuanus TaxID=3040969 RepID=UPI0036DA4F73
MLKVMIVTPAFLDSAEVKLILLQPLIITLCVFFCFKCVSYKQHIAAFWFLIHSAIYFHFIELYETKIQGKTVVYWEVNYPFPMYNRDYVYVRDRRDLYLNGRTIHVILAKSFSIPEIPEKDGIIRVKDYRQSLVIESDGKQGCKVSMFYHDNPEGMIPSWLINWAAKNGVPNFLKDILKACKNYHKKT